MDPSLRMILIAGALLLALFAATISSVTSHPDDAESPSYAAQSAHL